MPACTRCRTNDTECQYVRSKRGLRKNTRNTSPQLIDENVFSTVPDTFPDWLDDAAFSTDRTLDVPTRPYTHCWRLDNENTDILEAKSFFQPLDDRTIQELSLPEDTLVALQEPGLVTPEVAYDPMIQLYYQNFHLSHPVVIPRKALNSPLCYLIPPALLSIMRYIGAHYYSNPSLRQEFRREAFDSLSDPTMQDGFKVQALLLLAIIDHSNGDEKSSHRLVQTASTLALEIGLNNSCFARENSYGHSAMEESWRRTYWELYVVDGLLAAFREQSSFRLYRQPTDIQLPCAEKLYNYDSVRVKQTKEEQTVNHL